MSRQSSLVVCRRPQGRHWQLGPLSPSRGCVVLLGWRIDPPPVDAGVHAPIDRILAESLTGCGRMTFLWSPDETAAIRDDDIVHATEPADGLSRLGARLAGQPNCLSLMTTRNTETAIHMFDVLGFDWSQQEQVALVSAPDALPPVLDRATILDLLSDSWLRRCVEFEDGPIRAVLRPGIDGDVAGLFCADTRIQSRICRTLDAACRAAGATWSEAADDRDFAERLIGQERHK